MSTAPETARDVIARIRRKRREQDHCLAVLGLWAQVQGQGIDIARVASFGFDDRALTPKEERLRHRPGRPDPYIEVLPNGQRRPLVYNYVRHHDGGITRLEPPLRAVYEYTG
jgi:hypothetical protein